MSDCGKGGKISWTRTSSWTKLYIWLEDRVLERVILTSKRHRKILCDNIQGKS